MLETLEPDVTLYENPEGGFIEYIGHLGGDLKVVNDARGSFGVAHKKFEPRDSGLLNRLARYDHKSPYYQSKLSVRVQANTNVRTQLWKHAVDNSATSDVVAANEISKRYTDMILGFTKLKILRSKPPESVKQGSSLPIPEEINQVLLEKINQHQVACQELYRDLLANGVCLEQSRFVLSQDMLTQWTWTLSLYGCYNLYKQRTNPDAQPETRWYAEKIGLIAADLFPVAWSMLVRWGITIPKQEKAELEAYEAFLDDLKSGIEKQVLTTDSLQGLIAGLEGKIKAIKGGD